MFGTINYLMELIFKQYTDANFNDLASCMQKLQTYVVDLDPLKQLQVSPGFGKVYTNNLINKVDENYGRVILVYDQDKIIGCIAGIIQTQTEDNLVGYIPSTVGRIIELFVSEEYRGFDIGKKLMEKMEDYFKEKKCDTSRVEVFVPNVGAHGFYQKSGYNDRLTDMIKLLK